MPSVLRLPLAMAVCVTVNLLGLARADEPHQAKPVAPFCVLSVEEDAGSLAILTPEGRALKRIPLGERPHEIAVSPDHKTAYVSVFGITDYDSKLGSPGNHVTRIDLTHGAPSGEYRLPAGLLAPHGVKLRPPGYRELFVNTEAGGETMLVFDAQSRRLLRRFPLPPLTHNFVFAADGGSLFSFAGPRGVTKLNASNGKLLAVRVLSSPVRGLKVAVNGDVLAGAKGAVVALRPSDLTEIRRYEAPGRGQFVYLDQASNGDIAAPSIGDGGVTIFPADGRPNRFTRTGKTPIFARRGPDDRLYIGNVQDDHITVLDPTGSHAVATLFGLGGPNGLDFGACPNSTVDHR